MDPTIATKAIAALGSLGGPDVEDVLVRLLQNGDTPRVSLLTAITAAGTAKSMKFAPALVALLDKKEPRDMYPTDDVRTCDMAASALEAVFGIHFVRTEGDYFTATIEDRDKAIENLKAWYAEESKNPSGDPKKAFITKLLTQQLAVLASNPTDDQRRHVRSRIDGALKTDFCLGYLPGVDSVIGPSVLDTWTILRVTEQRLWYKHTNPWQELALPFARAS